MRRKNLIYFACFWCWFAAFSARAVESAKANNAKWEFVAEFEKTKAVALSEDLLAADYHAVELVAGILSARSQVWILVRPQTKVPSLKAMLSQGGIRPADFENIRFVTAPHGNIWLRDYGPKVLGRRKGEGDLSEISFLDAIYRDPTGPENDILPSEIGKNLGIKVISFSFELDGGNFLTTGDLCLTSHMSGSTPVSKNMMDVLGKLGCGRLIDLDDAPHAHVDMWVKFVSPSVAFVHEIQDETLLAAKAYYGGFADELVRLRQILNQKASELAQVVKVKRLPLPLPYRNVFRTFTNAILVNGVAIVPRYQTFGWTKEGYPDQSLLKKYEAKVEKAYEQEGFRVVWINADALVFNGGAFRCATFQIPNIGQLTSPRKGTSGGRTL